MILFLALAIMACPCVVAAVCFSTTPGGLAARWTSIPLWARQEIRFYGVLALVLAAMALLARGNEAEIMAFVERLEASQ